ncbi:MAG: hypothetical protein KGH57_01245 [Candidatus Micrarchaeota archaeon]|nr:hypothetical protein [Candidatus Micrarchaeota archaeon]
MRTNLCASYLLSASSSAADGENTRIFARANGQKARDSEIVGYARKMAALLKEDTGMDLTRCEFSVEKSVPGEALLELGSDRVTISREAYENSEEYGRVDGVSLGMYVLGAQMFQTALMQHFPHVPDEINNPEIDAATRAEWVLMTEAYGRLFSVRCIYDIKGAEDGWREHVANYMTTILALSASDLDSRMPGFLQRFDPNRETIDATNSFRSTHSFIPYLEPRMNELMQLDEESQVAYSEIMASVAALVLSPSKEAVSANIRGYMNTERELEQLGNELLSVRRQGLENAMSDPDWRYN